MEYKNDLENDNELKEAALKYNYLSPEDYLTFERASVRDKHELHEGHLVTMQGATKSHNRIVANLLGGIVPHLKGNRCEVFPSDLRVYIPSAESFTYPDLSIVCGSPEDLDDTYLDTIKNPAVIVEVLSPSTEKYDRGTKFFYYMQIAALKEYIMVSSTSRYIQTARKQAGGLWQFNELSGKEAVLSIPTIQYQLPLSEVYDRVEFLGK